MRLIRERGSAPKRGRHSAIFVSPQSASVHWRPDGLTIRARKWFLGAGFQGHLRFLSSLPFFARRLVPITTIISSIICIISLSLYMYIYIHICIYIHIYIYIYIHISMHIIIIIIISYTITPFLFASERRFAPEAPLFEYLPFRPP